MDIQLYEIGADPSGKLLCTSLIQDAIDKIHTAGGGKLTISNGMYLTGTIVMKSNVELHLAAGGVLLGSSDCKDYPEREDVRHVVSSRLPRYRNACLIFAEESENITISGNGKIDCNGLSFVKKKEEATSGWKYERIDAPTPPRVMFFTGCRNLQLKDFTMVNQPAGWSIWIHDCDYVSADRLKLLADVHYPNNDGIHVNSSRDVTISGCSIVCGDDCIIVRANNLSLPENKVCERVAVTNCNLTSYSCGIRVGWIRDGVIRNCVFSNLVMTDTSFGIGIVLPLRRNVADMGREATLIENLSFSNITMDKISSYPIRLSIHPDPEVLCTAIRDIHFSGIHARSTEFPEIQGRPDCHIQNISFSDCSFQITDGGEIPNIVYHGPGSRTEHKTLSPLCSYADQIRINNTVFTAC